MSLSPACDIKSEDVQQRNVCVQVPPHLLRSLFLGNITMYAKCAALLACMAATSAFQAPTPLVLRGRAPFSVQRPLPSTQRPQRRYNHLHGSLSQRTNIEFRNFCDIVRSRRAKTPFDLQNLVTFLSASASAVNHDITAHVLQSGILGRATAQGFPGAVARPLDRTINLRSPKQGRLIEQPYFDRFL